ncbi:MAG: hypothetical protein J2P33_02555 [Actinobacteria bacterium]|nr:hypothetical protein [Actinomycetota bacterium]
MRKIVAGMFVALDGVIESPDTWTEPYFSPQVGQAVGSLIAAQDTMLLGRVTYQGFAEAFGGQSGGMACCTSATSPRDFRHTAALLSSSDLTPQEGVRS